MFNQLTAALGLRAVDQAPVGARPQTYVHCFALDPVDNVFDAEALWGQTNDRRGRTIANVLRENPVQRYKGRKDKLFSMVEVIVSEEAMQLDYFTARREGALGLKQRLIELHQHEMGAHSSDDIRYAVIADPQLAPNMACVRFGHGVFVAPDEGADTRVIVQYSPAKESEWIDIAPVLSGQRLVVLGASGSACTFAVPDWPFGMERSLVWAWDEPEPARCGAAPTHSLAVEYDGRTGLCRVSDPAVTGPDAPQLLLRFHRVAVSVPAAPAQVMQPVVSAPLNTAAKTVTTSTDTSPALPGATTASDVSATSPSTAVPSDMAVSPVPGAHAAAAAAAAAAALAKARATEVRHNVASNPTPTHPDASSPEGQALIAQATGKPSSSEAQHETGNPDATMVSQPRTAGHAAYEDGTLVQVPRAQLPTHQLRLAGLMLQRVSTFAHAAEVESFELGFDAAANPAAPDATVNFRLRVDREDRLLAITPRGEALVAPPQAYRTHQNDGAALIVEPPPSGMEAYAVAVARSQWNFAQALIEGGEIRFGRLEAQASQLRVLEGLHCVRVARQSAPQKADRLGLSSRAATLTLQKDALHVRLDSATQLAFVLDEHFNLITRLDAEHPTREATLTPGQHLVLSHYVLRFERMSSL